MQVRNVALVVHRYVGLFMAVFLLVAGLTGSVLAFYYELDGVLNPGLVLAPAPAPEARPLDPLVLRERLERALPPGARAVFVPLHHEPGQAARFHVEATAEESDDEYFVDPYSGKLLGSRRFGAIEQGTKSLLSFVYRLHYTLALGTVGTYLMGAVALLWTVDCFLGAYLTLPPPAREPRARWWLARWKPAWLVRANHLFGFIFTWHRASGLWVWGMLLVFAWSAVAMNLPGAYEPVMNAAFGHDTHGYESLPELAAPLLTPALSWRDARTTGRVLMAKQAAERGFSVYGEHRLSYDAEHGAYRYVVRSSRDFAERYPATMIWFDGTTGALLAFEMPSGEHRATTITSLILALHFGDLAGGGLLYRIFVCALGTAVVALSITGVWIWWRKLRATSARSARRS